MTAEHNGKVGMAYILCHSSWYFPGAILYCALIILLIKSASNKLFWTPSASLGTCNVRRGCCTTKTLIRIRRNLIWQLVALHRSVHTSSFEEPMSSPVSMYYTHSSLFIYASCFSGFLNKDLPMWGLTTFPMLSGTNI